MRVRELKEKLKDMDDRLTVMIPTTGSALRYVPLNHVEVGVNVWERCVFLDCIWDEEDW